MVSGAVVSGHFSFVSSHMGQYFEIGCWLYLSVMSGKRDFIWFSAPLRSRNYLGILFLGGLLYLYLQNLSCPETYIAQKSKKNLESYRFKNVEKLVHHTGEETHL